MSERIVTIASAFCCACGVAASEPNYIKPTIAQIEPSLLCETAWSGYKARSRQATIAPAEGGYRLLDPEQRNALYDRIASRRSEGEHEFIDADTFNALSAALHDLGGALKKCMPRDAGTSPLRYVLNMRIVGARTVGSVIDKVSVRRIVTIRVDGTEELTSTDAEECFGSLLSRLELPPGRGPASVQILVRASDCADTYSTQVISERSL